MNKTIPMAELPLRIAAVSRCYRAETAHSADARGLYRVHQFTKVLFGTMWHFIHSFFKDIYIQI